LPLEYFDDVEFDLRTPSDWLELGKQENGSHSLPVCALLKSSNGVFAWAEAFAIAYDTNKNAFEIISHAGAEPLMLPRVFVMFYAEDPTHFAKRVVSAYLLRKETEALLQYHLCVDCMPPDEGQTIDEAMLERMVNLANSKRTAKRSA
jgi:dynein heavy chain